MRKILRTLVASALVLSGLALAPAVASAEVCGSVEGSCEKLPECGPANEGQLIWSDDVEYQCSRDEQGYYWGKTGSRRVLVSG